MARFIFLFLITVFLPLSAAAGQEKDLERLVQLIDYVGIDYQAAVADGQIISAAEYAEMTEFAVAIEAFVRKLPASAAATSLQDQAAALKALIAGKAAAPEVTSLTGQMRSDLLKSYALSTAPARAPDLRRGQTLYQEACAACHGATGEGDGPLAQGLEPQPTNFRDSARAAQRSLYGLFNIITYGVEGTAMADFSTLTNAERWDLAAYVGQLAIEVPAVERGEAVWRNLKQDTRSVNLPVTLQSFTTLSAKEATLAWRDGGDLMAYLRRFPDVLYSQDESPLMFARTMIDVSWQTYQQGDRKQAYSQALTAYLEGFELAEASLSAVDAPLMKTAEKAMFTYRNSLQKETSLQTVRAHYDALQSLLQKAQDRVAEKDGLTPTAAFIASFVILLREGLEALLVVVALSAFLIKTDRRDAMPYLHVGWISALLLGAATWFVSERILQIGGATREVTEGLAALTAAIMLLFVGYWLHSRTSAAGWQKFIQDSVEASLTKRTLWGLAGLSFISVYREVFETILFYQALWAQTSAQSANAIMTGLVSAIFLLVCVAWLVTKYSVRLPLRQFFGGTSALLLILSFIFAGKGIAALQEAGKISQSFTPLPSLEWLGIFPTWEGLATQAIILITAVSIYIRSRNARTKTHPV